MPKIGLRFPAGVPGKVWEVPEIIGTTGSLRTLIAELVATSEDAALESGAV